MSASLCGPFQRFADKFISSSQGGKGERGKYIFFSIFFLVGESLLVAYGSFSYFSLDCHLFELCHDLLTRKETSRKSFEFFFLAKSSAAVFFSRTCRFQRLTTVFRDSEET